MSLSTYRTDTTDDAYTELLSAVARRLATTTEDPKARLFHTDATGLYDAFLAALPEPLRQQHRCGTCRRFVERVGGLAVIADDGRLVPALWDPGSALPTYGAAVRALASRVAGARVTGPLVTGQITWGHRERGGFAHLAIELPKHVRTPASPLHDFAQLAGMRRHEHALLHAALRKYPLPLARRAARMLETGELPRSEACSGIAQWLVALHESLDRIRDARRRDNSMWRASAAAPPGYCHLRSGMLGTLLDDLHAGVPFPEIRRRFAAKMHPLQYMRPTAPPSEGNIVQAEKMFATLAAGGALARRFARLEDLTTRWRPRSRPNEGGLFDHLRRWANVPQDDGVGPVRITWVKFARTVLPEAEAIELMVDGERRSYGAFVTAASADAAPVLQWDHPDRRNPVSIYVYVDGSLPQAFDLTAGKPCAVTGIALHPSGWTSGEAFSHVGNQVWLVLDGARDRRYVRGGGLFPESLRSDFHPVRKTIEAHMQQAVIAGADQATACGLMLGGTSWNAVVRVTAGGIRTRYLLDRWD